jgi:hypothetical protein
VDGRHQAGWSEPGAAEAEAPKKAKIYEVNAPGRSGAGTTHRFIIWVAWWRGRRTPAQLIRRRATATAPGGQASGVTIATAPAVCIVLPAGQRSMESCVQHS